MPLTFKYLHVETWLLLGLGSSTGAAREGPKEPCPPQIFRKYSHFAFWEAFFQTK